MNKLKTEPKAKKTKTDEPAEDEANDTEESTEEVSSDAVATSADADVVVAPGSISIQRYKGLGEMNPTQLWETTMDPEKRILLKVSEGDAAKADETFSMLMGDDVAPRKRFIQTHAKYVKNLDV